MLTGLNIENYILIDTEGLVELVDTIGGVEFNVPIDMKYDDKKQGLHINLKAGVQVLDGDKAEQLVRFRKNNDNTTYSGDHAKDDYGRMQTQREFIIETVKQTIEPSTYTSYNQLISGRWIEENSQIFYPVLFIDLLIDF